MPAGSRDGAADPTDGPELAAGDGAPAGDLSPTAARSAGDACTDNRACASGVCADGVCCLTACTELCRACNLPGNGGTCTDVPMGKPPGRPGECLIDASNTCGHTGFCNGAARCQLAEASTVCGARVCDPTTNLLTAEPRCDGQGRCQPPPIGLPCAPARCNAARNGCANPCTSSDECLAPNQCVSGSCGKADNGLPCTAADQCRSNFCADGVCCDGACGGQCEACDVTGSSGACGPVSGAPHHRALPARPDCGGDLACPGTCDGSNRTRCTYPANRCRARSCSPTNEVINEATCDANGVCPALRTTACTNVCRSGACTICTPDTRQCANPTTPQFCDGNGVWQNRSCSPVGNMQPACAPDGNCGLRCESHMGVVAATLPCVSGNICPLWNFETGGTDGWIAVTGSRGNAQPMAVRRSLGNNNSFVLAVPVDFSETSSQLVIRLTLCAGGIGIRDKDFSFRVWMEGDAASGSFGIYPRAIGPSPDRATDTPNGLSGPAGQWIEDNNERFILDVTRDLELVVNYFGTWSGTAYFDDVRLN